MLQRRDDHAESGVLAELLLVGVAIAGALLLFVFYTASPSETLPAVAMNDDGVASGGTKSFTIAASPWDLDWGELSPFLDGTPLAYDSALASENTYCIVATGATCAPTGSWDGSLNVAAGQQLRVHHSALPGRTLSLRQDTLNAIVFHKILGN